jgi:hypothetical protein
MERPPGASGHDQANYGQPENKAMRIDPPCDPIRVTDLTFCGLTASLSVGFDEVYKRDAKHDEEWHADDGDDSSTEPEGNVDPVR